MSFYNYSPGRSPPSNSPPTSQLVPVGSGMYYAVRSPYVSPNSIHGGKNYPSMSWKARFEATRGFDLEDDMEFCPTIIQNSMNSSAAFSNPSNPEYYTNSPLNSPSFQHSSVSSSASSASSSHNTITYYGGSSTAASASSTGNSGNFSSTNGTSTPASYSPNRTGSSFQPPKARKGIQIIDPQTGLKVGSPSLSSAGLQRA